MNYQEEFFILTMNGGEMPLTVYGIGTPKFTVKADASNLAPVYVGNIYENGSEGAIRPLTADNNKKTLQPSREVCYADTEQYDRFPRERNPFLENNRLHILSQWYVKGTAGDIVFVTWLFEGNAIVDINNQVPIDTSQAGLSR